VPDTESTGQAISSRYGDDDLLFRSKMVNVVENSPIYISI
jgi:hypothetical protein